ncbi:MAG: transcription termination factor NusA [SAR324 cluster bacterium]|nr:transcription termination factor NusA [SAR324 cluster bacterium]MBL7035339.1 transcription termination factor NusA [SAR324 cluster bacterium]
MKENLYEIIKDFSREKGLDHEVVIKLVEESLIQAAQRKLPYHEIEGSIDEKTGKINLVHFKEVVEFVEDTHNEISIDDVIEIDPDAGLGDEVEYEISDREFLRIAHSTRPIIFGSLKEAERQMVVSTFTDKVGEVLTGTVLRVEPNGRVAFSFQNKVEAYLFRREQIYGENFTFGDHVRVFLLDVNDNPHKDSQLTISRTHPGLLIKLFEMEVPEIFDGIVKIVNASREPGRRAKISVYSTDEEVDPVGSCVGMRGSRVQTIVNDLNGEKIDIVRWNEDISEYTCNALAPAEIESLDIDEETKQIDVIVAQNQLSLAIGHKGQNVRLASKLIGYKINIVATEEEELSIDQQLEKEFAKTKINDAAEQEDSETPTEEGILAESHTTSETNQTEDNNADLDSSADTESGDNEQKSEGEATHENNAEEDITAEVEEIEVVEAEETKTEETEAVTTKTKAKTKSKTKSKTAE